MHDAGEKAAGGRPISLLRHASRAGPGRRRRKRRWPNPGCRCSYEIVAVLRRAGALARWPSRPSLHAAGRCARRWRSCPRPCPGSKARSPRSGTRRFGAPMHRHSGPVQNAAGSTEKGHRCQPHLYAAKLPWRPCWASPRLRLAHSGVTVRAHSPHAAWQARQLQQCLARIRPVHGPDL